jgi:hypothetical protein
MSDEPSHYIDHGSLFLHCTARHLLSSKAENASSYAVGTPQMVPCRLPVEITTIILEILALSLHTSEQGRLSFFTHYGPGLTPRASLLKVCTLLRDLTIAKPVFWRYIDVDRDQRCV